MNHLLRTILAAVLLVGCATAPVHTPSASETAATAPAARAATGTDARTALPVGSYTARTTLVVEADGRYRRTFEESYVLLSSSPPRFYTQLETEFDPARDELPQLTARVTLPDGSVKELDPTTIAETPVDASTPDNFSDRRRVIAPLPALVAGSVVYRSWSRVTSRPVADFGQSWTLPMATMLPAEEMSVVVDHPADLPLDVRPLALDVEPAREESGGRVRLTWTRKQPPGVDLPGHMPPESRAYPEIYVSTAPSWQAVARGYLKLVGDALDPAPVRTLAGSLKPASSRPVDVAAAALDWMHHNLRYTGLDFGNAGVIPHAAGETLQRGYGDCKDLAAFLVALLEARGIDARIALLSTSRWHEGPEQAPGLGRFDHAIVYVPAAELWIDPTLRGVGPGVLGDFATARLALVVDEATTALVRTPDGTLDWNRAVIRNEITLPESGLGTIHTERSLTGTAMGWRRNRAAAMAEDQLLEVVQNEIAQAHDTKDFAFRHSDPLRASGPYTETVDVRGSAKALASDSDAIAPLGFEVLLDMLPRALHAEESPEGGETDVFVGAPSELEVVTRVHTGPLFQLKGGAVSRAEQAPGVQWTYEIEPLPDGAEARLRLRLDKRVVAAADVPAVRRALSQLFHVDNRLDFDNRIMRLLGEGKLQTASEELRKLRKQSPKSALLVALQARTALAANLGAEARRLAKQAAKMAPDSAPVHRTLALVLAHDEWGRSYHEGLDRAGAIAAARKARELDPQQTWSHQIEIEMLARNDAGELAGPGAATERALEELRAFRKDGDTSEDALYVFLLWRAGLDEELVRETEKSAEPQGITVAALARSRGLPAALAWVDARAASQREQLLAAGAVELFTSREYPLAHGLAVQVRDPRFSMMTGLLEKARRREEQPLDLDRSIDVMVETMALAIGATARVDADRLGFPEEERVRLSRSLRPTFEQLPLSQDAIVDLSCAMLTAEEEEVPGIGILAVFRSPLMQPVPGLLQREKNGLRIHPAATASDRVARAWQALAAKDTALARRWIEVLLRLDAGDLPLLREREPLLRALLEGSDDDVALAVALSTLDMTRHAKQAVPVLERAYGAPSPRSGAAHHVGLAYVGALTTAGRYDDALRLVDELEQREIYRGRGSALRARFAILDKAGRADALEALARQELARDAKSEDGFFALSRAALLRDDLDAYRNVWMQMADAGIRRESALNNAAWASLYLGVEDEDVRRAERAIGPKADSPSALDTLAVLLAERGDADRAVRTLERLTSVRPVEEAPPDSQKYALGRIAESLGFEQAAVDLYRQIEPAKQHIADLHGPARKRLAKLGVKN